MVGVVRAPAAEALAVGASAKAAAATVEGVVRAPVAEASAVAVAAAKVAATVAAAADRERQRAQRAGS